MKKIVSRLDFTCNLLEMFSFFSAFNFELIRNLQVFLKYSVSERPR